jgi:phosphoglycolate phosphatase
LRRPEAILWDWDNTLVDGWAAMTAAINVAFAAYAMPSWTEAEMRARAVGSIRDVFPGLFGAGWERARDLYLAAFSATHLERLRAMPGAEAALAAGAAWLAWPQGIVSNKTGTYLKREVAHLGWNGHFCTLVGAGDAAADKPHPAPIWHALTAIGMRPTPTIWCVGDTGSDMRAARAAGAPRYCSAMPAMTAASRGCGGAVRHRTCTTPMPRRWRHDFVRCAGVRHRRADLDTTTTRRIASWPLRNRRTFRTCS